MMKKLVVIIFCGFVVLTAAFAIVFYQPDISVDQLKKKYAVSPSKFAFLGNMNVHYRDEGVLNDSLPLVLLHGTSSSLFTWEACVREWSKEHRIIRMDLPAFAITGPNPEQDYTIQNYVAFLDQFLGKLNVKQCYLAGNSLGGLIAYQYAAIHPDKVKKIILIDPAGYPNHQAKGSLAFKLGKIPVLKNILTIITPISIVRKSLEDTYSDKSRVSDGLVELYRDMACREGNRKALLIRLQTDQHGDTSLVSKVIMPAMLIWGLDDQVIPLDNAFKFQRDLPNDTLIVLPNVGHLPMEETPELVIPLVTHFIRN